MFPHPRYHGTYGRAGYRQRDIQMIAGTLASLLDQGSMPWEWYGAPPRPFRRGPRRYPRRPYYYGYPRPDRYQRRFPQETVHGIGVSTRCPGEAIRWPSEIQYPGGTVATEGKRGSLVGDNPEAPSGEAPKGQPMIRGKNLEAVCVEAPQGQPRNH